MTGVQVRGINSAPTEREWCGDWFAEFVRSYKVALLLYEGRSGYFLDPVFRTE